MKRLLLLLSFFFFAINGLLAQVPSYVPTNGLVGWWPFNGNANDESGNGNHGSLSNTGYPMPLAVDRNGAAQAAYTFSSPHALNGVYLNLGNPSSVANFGTSSFSISVWFRTAANFGVSTNLPMLYYGANGSINTTWYLGAYVNSLLRGVTSGSYNYVVSSINSVADTAWHNAVYLRDVASNEYRLYLDGVLLSNNNYGAFIENIIGSGNSQLYVGANPYGNPFYGDIDDIGIWHRALTVVEIQALYNGTISGVESLPQSELVESFVSGNTLFTRCELSNSKFLINDVTGRNILSGVCGKGMNNIDISLLLPGIYFITVNGQSFKFSKL
jgi:hypothetical protein